MPRKSAASLEIAAASIDVAARRVKPPAGLPDPVAKIWHELVDSLPANRFHASDRPLLALYCRALHQAGIAFDKLEKFGAFAEDEFNPWLKVSDITTKQAAVLAVRLRLCPQSRMDRKTAGPAARKDHAQALGWQFDHS